MNTQIHVALITHINIYGTHMYTKIWRATFIYEAMLGPLKKILELIF